LKYASDFGSEGSLALAEGSALRKSALLCLKGNGATPRGKYGAALNRSFKPPPPIAAWAFWLPVATMGTRLSGGREMVLEDCAEAPTKPEPDVAGDLVTHGCCGRKFQIEFIVHKF
jgi:hypothetical protein